jgi:RNA polymerase sigma factor (TIGR02999 family)
VLDFPRLPPSQMSEPGEITALLRRLRSGDRAAADRLVEKAYPELHRIAQAHFRHERPGHVLQPTALVNEAWQKFVALAALQISDRVHFLSLCSRLMRQVLVDHARRRATHERAVEFMRIDDRIEADALDLDLALAKLAEAHPRPARIVELRYFGGLSIEEIAQSLEVSPATVKRDWLAARAWLYRQLHGDSP